MLKIMRKATRYYCLCLLASIFLFSSELWAEQRGANLQKFRGLTEISFKSYVGGEDGGLAHTTYWGLPAAAPDYFANLSPKEQAKAGKINANVLHAAAFQPTNASLKGIEIAGLLTRGQRKQSITFRMPDNWNGKMVVAGTPGLRNEYANEAVLVPWLLEAGYAYIAGDKGIPGGAADMLSGNHPSQYWGKMMIDLAKLGRRCSQAISGETPTKTYAMGLSNGGYQTRRALEIDHQRVLRGRQRLFDGGVDWSGTYWPDKRVLDADNNGRVSIEEYAAAETLIGATDKAMRAMGWFYASDTNTTLHSYVQNPRFPEAYLPMIDSGFSPESSIFWGYYNTIFDGFQYIPGFEIFRGVGYYNLVSFVYRADLLGDDAASSAVYSCYSNPSQPDAIPPLYGWLDAAESGGWTREGVKYALKNANTGEFSVPLLSLQGQADGLLALNSQGLDYKDAIELFGDKSLHRFYIIAHSGHVDKHADGGWGYSSAEADSEIADLLTPMQPYAERTFHYLVDWVENGIAPPANTFVETDPANDIVNADELDW